MLVNDADCPGKHSREHRNHPKNPQPSPHVPHISTPCPFQGAPGTSAPTSASLQRSTDGSGGQSTSGAADELAQGCADQEFCTEPSRRCSFAFPALKGEAERVPSPGSTFSRSVLTPHSTPGILCSRPKPRAVPPRALKQSPVKARGTPAQKCHRECSPIPKGFTDTSFPGLGSGLGANTEGSWQHKEPGMRRKWSHQVQTQIS